MHPMPLLRPDSVQLLGQPPTVRATLHDEAPVPTPGTVVGEAEEGERLGRRVPRVRRSSAASLPNSMRRVLASSPLIQLPSSSRRSQPQQMPVGEQPGLAASKAAEPVAGSTRRRRSLLYFRMAHRTNRPLKCQKTEYRADL